MHITDRCSFTGKRRECTALSLSSGLALLSDAINLAYRILNMEHKILCANPHQVRGMAASWAKIARVLVKEIYVVWLLVAHV